MPDLKSVEAPVARHSTKGSVHLDALRGAAALLVFLNHTRALYFSSFLKPAAPSPAHPGTQLIASQMTELGGEIKIASAAVVVFFVLSGYLVGGSAIRSVRTRTWSWKDYLTKRLVRLFVVLVPAVAMGACLDRIGLRVFGPGSIYTGPAGLHLMVSADLLQRLSPTVLLGNIFFLQGIVVPLEGTNVSIWSLANEFWYYIAFPLALCAVSSQYKGVFRILSFLAACLVLWFVGLQIALLFPIWLLGAFVGALPVVLSRSSATLLSVASTVALIGGVAAVRIMRLHAVEAEYIIGLLSTVLLYGLIAQKEAAQPGVYRSFAGFFSRISYSLYMFHLPIAVFLCAIANSPWMPYRKTLRHLSWYVASDLIVICVVYLLWRIFEANTDAIRKRFFTSRKRIAGQIPAAER